MISKHRLRSGENSDLGRKWGGRNKNQNSLGGEVKELNISEGGRERDFEI